MSRASLIPVSLILLSAFFTPVALSASPIQWWTVSQASAQVPLGTLANLTKAGFAAGLGVEASHLGIDGLVLGVHLQYANLASNSSRVSSIQQSGVMAMGGYNLPITEVLSVTPRFGIGYYGVFTSGTKVGFGTQMISQIGVGGSWTVDKNWRVDTAVDYRGIAESVAWYSGVSLGLGLAYRLPVDTL